MGLLRHLVNASEHWESSRRAYDGQHIPIEARPSSPAPPPHPRKSLLGLLFCRPHFGKCTFRMIHLVVDGALDWKEELGKKGL